MRSAWNSSRSSDFSPTPTNRIGFPDLLDRESGAAAGVAVELRQDDACEAEEVVEFLRRLHGVLSRHRVADEERLVRLRPVADLAQLVHERLVDVQPAGGVEDDDVAMRLPRLRDAALADLWRPSLALHVDGDAERVSDRRELLDGGGALDVRGDEKRRASFLREVLRELPARRRLAAALKPRHEDHGRRRRSSRDLPRVRAAEKRDQLVVDDLHDELVGLQALQHLLADGLLRDALDELLRDLEVNVGLEEGLPHLAEPFLDVRLGEAALSPEVPEGVRETRADAFEHDRSVSARGREGKRARRARAATHQERGARARRKLSAAARRVKARRTLVDPEMRAVCGEAWI